MSDFDFVKVKNMDNLEEESNDSDMKNNVTNDNSTDVENKKEVEDSSNLGFQNNNPEMTNNPSSFFKSTELNVDGVINEKVNDERNCKSQEIAAINKNVPPPPPMQCSIQSLSWNKKDENKTTMNQINPNKSNQTSVVKSNNSALPSYSTENNKNDNEMGTVTIVNSDAGICIFINKKNNYSFTTKTKSTIDQLTENASDFTVSEFKFNNIDIDIKRDNDKIQIHHKNHKSKSSTIKPNPTRSGPISNEKPAGASKRELLDAIQKFDITQLRSVYSNKCRYIS